MGAAAKLYLGGAASAMAAPLQFKFNRLLCKGQKTPPVGFIRGRLALLCPPALHPPLFETEDYCEMTNKVILWTAIAFPVYVTAWWGPGAKTPEVEDSFLSFSDSDFGNGDLEGWPLLWPSPLAYLTRKTI
jgi:hypothetical protein